jgi:TP53 regulating kinase and related kinases
MSRTSATGAAVRRMHDEDVVHGDLTTSNVIVQAGGGGGVVLIDFGLSVASAGEEDKAVDLYVLERAVVATVPARAAGYVGAFLRGYSGGGGGGGGGGGAAAVLARLEEVRARGRKRDMTG